MAYYKGTLGLIGNTPLVEVTNIEKELGLEATVLVKLEYFNPAGSVKDRIAKAMIEDAEHAMLRREMFSVIDHRSLVCRCCRFNSASTSGGIRSTSR